MHVALDGEQLREPLRRRSGVDDHRAVLRHLLDGLGRDPQLLLGVDHVARRQQRLVVDPLHGHGAAVHAAKEIPALHVGQVAPDRLRAHPVAAGEVRHIHRSLAQREHVDRVLPIVLEAWERGALVGGHHGALTAAIGPSATIRS